VPIQQSGQGVVARHLLRLVVHRASADLDGRASDSARPMIQHLGRRAGDERKGEHAEQRRQPIGPARHERNAGAEQDTQTGSEAVEEYSDDGRSGDHTPILPTASGIEGVQIGRTRLTKR
jgi:hypothetical protein